MGLALYAPSAVAAPTITEFAVPGVRNPDGIAAARDGNLWLTTANGKIGRVSNLDAATPTIKTFRSRVGGKIVAGPDGNLWFSVYLGIGRVSNLGAATPTITTFTLPSSIGPSSDKTGLPGIPQGIAAGPDGNLWYTINFAGLVGRVNNLGAATPTITEFTSQAAGQSTGGMVAGPDGNLWFTEAGTNQIGRVSNLNAATPTITGFAVPTPNSGPSGIAAGPDGNVWFMELLAGKIGRVSNLNAATPTITEFPAPPITASSAATITGFRLPRAGSFPRGIAAGRDGNLWFTTANGKIGKVSNLYAATPTITALAVPTPRARSTDIVAGPDGNLWFTETVVVEGVELGKIGRISDLVVGVTRYGLSRSTFAAAAKGGSAQAASATKKGGTTVSYALSKPATVKFTVEKGAKGRRLKGSFSHRGKQGKNRFKFTGRLKNRKLRPGKYQLVAKAVDAARNSSSSKRVKFKIVKG